MVVAPLAIDLLAILACCGALILILCSKQLAEALVAIIRGTVGRAPLVGRFFGKAADWVEKQIVSQMADVANGLEGLIGAFWHALGNLLASIGNEIVGLSKAVGQLADYMHGVVRPWVVHTVIGGIQRGVKWLKHELAHTRTQVYRVTKVIEHPAHTKIGGAVRTITRPLSVGLDRLQRWTHTQVARLDHAIAVPIEHGIAGLRSRTGTLERAYERLWKQVRSIDQVKAASVAAALVAVAVARLGFGWVRCGNWRTAGRAVCRMNGSLLETLLLGTTAIFGTISLVTLAEALVELEDELVPLVLAGFSEFNGIDLS